MSTDFSINRLQSGQIDASTALHQLNEVLQRTLDGTVPPAQDSMAVNDMLKTLGLPVLSTPVGGMSLDALMSAIGNETRRQACKAGVDSLEGKAAEQKKINEEQLEKLGEQLEKMKQQKVLNGFLKAFKIIGMIVGAIASIATIAVGAITANPLLIAAGVIGMAMTIDSVLSMATDGKISMMAGFEALGKTMGMSDETAQWFAFGMQMGIMLISIGVSMGAGLATTSASAANVSSQAAQRALDVTIMAQKVLNFTSAGLSVADGACTIGGAVIQYQADKIKISAKELEAILERIREAIEMDRKLVESEMERVNDLMAKVMDIVKGCTETQTAILSTAPTMA
ncbi:MAG: type III secretion system protein [Desulfomicrobium sp.]|jgi:hypothetical protein|nr:type III secretion system protein [Desulfomicrobium sp.]